MRGQSKGSPYLDTLTASYGSKSISLCALCSLYLQACDCVRPFI
uniref:Uncharacterized protein n=1 Tax=Anguilla anguilla TaxID=7936 RepID=A0A0E9PI99_ANGAN